MGTPETKPNKADFVRRCMVWCMKQQRNEFGDSAQSPSYDGIWAWNTSLQQLGEQAWQVQTAPSVMPYQSCPCHCLCSSILLGFSSAFPLLCLSTACDTTPFWQLHRSGFAGSEDTRPAVAGGRHGKLSQAPTNLNPTLSPKHLAGQTKCLTGQGSSANLV